MLKKIAIAAALALSVPFAASATEVRGQSKPLDLQLAAPRAQQGYGDVIAVEHGRPAVAVIATDALYGGLAGAAIGAGVALINGNDYGRDIAVGAGIGLIAGGIVGAVSIADQRGHATEGSNYMDRPTFGTGGKF